MHSIFQKNDLYEEILLKSGRSKIQDKSRPTVTHMLYQVSIMSKLHGLYKEIPCVENPVFVEKMRILVAKVNSFFHSVLVIEPIHPCTTSSPHMYRFKGDSNPNDKYV